MKRTAQTGFTLIEIIVAVSIFGVIMGIVFPSLMQFLEIRERLDEKHQELTQLQKVFLFMGNDLRYATNRVGKDEYGELGKTSLSVDQDYLLELTAAYPDVQLDGLSVPRRLRWQLEDGELKRTQFPVMDPDPATRGFTQLLLSGVDNVEFEVSHISDGRSNTDNDWDEQSSLPDLVEVVLDLEDGRTFTRVFSLVSTSEESVLSATSANEPVPFGGGDQNPTSAGEGDEQ